MSSPAKHYPHFFTPPTQFGDNSRLPQLRNRDQAFGIRPHDDEDEDEDVHPSFKRSKLPNTTLSMPKLNTRSKREATPYKTRMCLEFTRSRCAFGDRRHFAHSSTEMRKRSSCWKDEVHVKEIATSCDHIKLCKWSSNGYDGNRGYYHNDDRRSCAIDIASVGGELKRSGDSSSRANEEYWCWKTKLCNNWQATNDCPYGSKCRFAHGKAELRNSEVKYRNSSSAVTLVDPAKDEAYKRLVDTEEQQVDGQGFLIRLKEVRKFIGIYADWIDDSTLGV